MVLDFLQDLRSYDVMGRVRISQTHDALPMPHQLSDSSCVKTRIVAHLAVNIQKVIAERVGTRKIEIGQ